MANSPKAKRYAQALFALAKERSATQDWLEEIEKVRSVVEEDIARLYFLSPRVRTKGKIGFGFDSYARNASYTS